MLRRITKLAAGHRRLISFNGGLSTHDLLMPLTTSTNNASMRNYHSKSHKVDIKDPVKFISRPNVDVVLYEWCDAFLFYPKLKAFLDYYDIPYKTENFDFWDTYRSKCRSSRLKVFPMMMVDGDLIVDSHDANDTIDMLAKRMHLDLTARSRSEQIEEKKWRGWVDDHLVRVMMLNVYRSFSEAVDSSEYLTNGELGNSKYIAAAFAYWALRIYKRMNTITDERAVLYDAARTWVDALNVRKFLGGTKPNLADLAVYGTMKPMRYRKSGKDMIEHTQIGDWYSRMEDAVGISSEIQA